DAGDSVAHVLGGDVDATGEIKLDDDVADTLAAFAAEGFDAFDIVDGLLEPLGNLGLDDLRVGPRIHGGDRDHGRIDVRQLAHRQPRKADDAKEHQHQIQDGGEERPLNGDAREEQGVEQAGEP